MAIFMNLGGMTDGMFPPVSHRWMELLTFEFDTAVKRAPVISSSSGSLKFDTAVVTKLPDRASARLIQLHMGGNHLRLCLVSFTRGDAPNSVAAGGFTLHDVVVVTFRTIRYSPMPKLVDELVLGFEQITLGHHSSRNLSSMEAEALSKMWKVSARN